jgi:inner membrane protein
LDPFTHITTGALGGQTIRDRFHGRYIFWFCVLSAWIPDMDNLIGLGDPEFSLLHHRGITHSFLGGLAIAVLLAAIFKFFIRSFPFLAGTLLSYACIGSHIFLDLITSYGTQIFAPFTNNRHMIQCVFILDPIFTLPLIIILYLSFRLKQKRRQIAVAGLLWVLLYPMANLGIRGALQTYLEKTLTQQHLSYSKIYVTPAILTPLFWKVIVEDADCYRVARLNMLKPEKLGPFELFQKADLNLMRKFGKRVSFFKTYEWFAVYPVMEKKETEDGSIVTFGDLRFYTNLKIIRQTFNRNNMEFSLTAVLDKQQEITGFIYHRPGRATTIQYLE